MTVESQGSDNVCHCVHVGIDRGFPIFSVEVLIDVKGRNIWGNRSNYMKPSYYSDRYHHEERCPGAAVSSAMLGSGA